ncbi:MAG: hypothetical protein ACYDHW_02295 [Syntrophorhabdaceae bacterium]
MKLYVRFDESMTFDVAAGKVIDPKSQLLGRKVKVVPFAEHISIRKLKPREKLSHKIGDRWISSRKLTFAYIMAYYMIKNEKSVLAGFFERGDGKFVFMEIKVGNMTIETRYMIGIDSTPTNFLAMAGRQYDGIFGNSSLTGEPDYISIPYEKILSEVTTHITILQAAIVLCIFAAITGGFLYYAGIFEKKKIISPETRALSEIPPLTPADIRALSILITSEALVTYKFYVEALPEDIALKSLAFHISPVSNPTKGKDGKIGKQELTGVLAFQFESFYPFRGSKRFQEFFSFEKGITLTKTRDDLKRAVELEVRAKGNKKGFETMIDFCAVSSRNDTNWKFTLDESDYKKAVRLLNEIYLSPIVIDSLAITEGKTTGEFTYHRF